MDVCAPQISGISRLGDIDGFRGLCGRAGGLTVYWRDDALEVFYPRGGLDTDKELSGSHIFFRIPGFAEGLEGQVAVMAAGSGY